MQTFLPYSDFKLSAAILDSKRLNKQILEGYQILTDRLSNKNHPACLMWKDSKKTLQDYILTFCKEYTKRFGKIHRVQEYIQDSKYEDTKPCFLQNKCNTDLLILSHRINLLRKNFEYYRKEFPMIPESSLDAYPEGYYWPVCVGDTAKKHSEGWIRFSLGLH